MITEQQLFQRALSREEAQTQYDLYSSSEYDWKTGTYTSNSPLPEHIMIMFSEYTYANYEGSSFAVGYNTELQKWFTVHGGHCSCYGLEGQWDEEYHESFESLMREVATQINYRWGGDQFGLGPFFEIEREEAV